MNDPFTIPRQSCRCGETFATLEAFLVHADYGEPLPHDNPEKIGLFLADGEWTHVLPPDDTDLVKSSGGKTIRAKRAPKGQAKPYVRAADRPSTDYERTCIICNATFERPRTRGRPPTKCQSCR